MVNFVKDLTGLTINKTTAMIWTFNKHSKSIIYMRQKSLWETPLGSLKNNNSLPLDNRIFIIIANWKDNLFLQEGQPAHSPPNGRVAKPLASLSCTLLGNVVFHPIICINVRDVLRSAGQKAPRVQRLILRNVSRKVNIQNMADSKQNVTSPSMRVRRLP